MKKHIFYFSLAVLLLNGCATSPEFKEDKHTKIYRQDLDCDGKREFIRVEDRFDTEADSFVTVMLRDGKKICDFSVPGSVTAVDFVDLYDNELSQIALFYKDSNNYQRLDIYSIKNNSPYRVSSFVSSCGIDADWSNIYRVKVCLPKCKSCSPGSVNTQDWQIWTWCGDKFIREN